MLQLNRRMLELIGNQLQIGEESPEYFLRVKRVEESSFDPYEWTGVPKGAMSIDISATKDSGAATAEVKIEDTYGLMSPRMIKPHDAKLYLTPDYIQIKPGEEAQFYAFVETGINKILVGGLGAVKPNECKWEIKPMGSVDEYGDISQLKIENGKVTNTTLPNGGNYAECYVTATYRGQTVTGALLILDKAYVVDIPNPIFQVRDNEEADGDWFFFEMNGEPLIFFDQATADQMGYGIAGEDPDVANTLQGFYSGIEVKAAPELTPGDPSFIGWNSGRYDEFPRVWTNIPLKLHLGVNKLTITATWNGRRGNGGGGNCTGNAQLIKPDGTLLYTEDGANGTPIMASIYMDPVLVDLDTGDTTATTQAGPQVGLYDRIQQYSDPRQTVTWLIEYRDPNKKPDTDPLKDLVIDDPAKYFDFFDDEELCDYTASHYLELLKPENYCQIGLGYGDVVIPVITGAIDTVTIDSKASTLLFSMRDNLRYMIDQTINPLLHGKQLTYPKTQITVSGTVNPTQTVAATKQVSTIEGYVSIRTGPRETENLIGMMNPGQNYIYYGTTNGWHCIAYGNSCGYVDGTKTQITEIGAQAVGEIPLGPTQSMVKIHDSIQYAPIYVQPSTTSQIIGNALPGNTFLYLRTVGNGTFFNIQYNGMSGYVLTTDASQTSENTDGSGYIAKYEAINLPSEWYLKSGPGETMPNTTQRVYNGDMLAILGVDGDWRKVKIDINDPSHPHIEGYIYKDNVKLVYVPGQTDVSTNSNVQWRATDIVLDLIVEATNIKCYEPNPRLDRIVCAGMIEDYYVYIDGELSSYTIPSKSFPISESYFDAAMEIVNMMGKVSLRCTRFGDIALRKTPTHTQLDTPNWLITDYIDLTSLTHKNDSVDVRNRILIKSDNGWNLYEHPMITEKITKGVNRTTAMDVGKMGSTEAIRRTAASNFFEQVLSKYYTMSIAIKGNPLIELDQCIEIRDMVSGANEKYSVREYKHSFTEEGFITQLELDYISTLAETDLIMLTDNFPNTRDTFNYKQYMGASETKTLKFKYPVKIQKVVIRIKKDDRLVAEITMYRDVQTHTETTQSNKRYVYLEQNQVNIRYTPDSSSADNIKRKADYGFFGEYVATEGSWYKLIDYDGNYVYMWAAYCSVKDGGTRVNHSTTTTTNTTGGVVNGSLVDSVIQYAEGWVGQASYVYGAMDPDNAQFDCSGFISYILAEADAKPYGYRGNTTSMFAECAEISRNELQPGDLCFIINGGGRSDHVGLYIGNGEEIDCASGAGGVVKRSVDVVGWNKYGRLAALGGTSTYTRTENTSTTLPTGTNTSTTVVPDHYKIETTFNESQASQASIDKAIALGGNVLCEVDGCVLYNVGIESEGTEVDHNIVKLYWASTNSSPVTLDLNYDIITYDVTNNDTLIANVGSNPGGSTEVSTSNMTNEAASVWQYIQKSATDYSLNPLWVAAIIAQESSFQNEPTNSANCTGYMQVSTENAQSFGYSQAEMSDPAKNIDAGCHIYRNNLDTAKSMYGAMDESDPLGQQYTYAWLLYGCWTNQSLWSSAAEGYLAYNKVRRIYKQYASGSRSIGDRCDDIIADLTAMSSMSYAETN